MNSGYFKSTLIAGGFNTALFQHAINILSTTFFPFNMIRRCHVSHKENVTQLKDGTGSALWHGTTQHKKEHIALQWHVGLGRPFVNFKEHMPSAKTLMA